MSRNSIVMLVDTEGEFEVTGEAVRADAFFGQSDGLHTIAIYLQNFIGRIFIEASLELEPEEEDWFPIHLDGDNPYLEFVAEDASLSNIPMNLGSGAARGKDGVIGFTFQGNFLFLRARLDRSFIPNPPMPTTISGNLSTEIAQFGVIRKILLNH